MRRMAPGYVMKTCFFLRERGIYLKVALELAKAADLRVIG